MKPEKMHDYDYLPYFYSRVFTLSWQFYGDNVGECILFGKQSEKKFGAFWVDSKGVLVGAFLEGGNKDEYAALEMVARLKPHVKDKEMLRQQGLAFPFSLMETSSTHSSSLMSSVAEKSQMLLEHPSSFTIQVYGGIAVAVGVSLFAFWYGKRRQRW
jgi:monodehydroascorbate reductase (NADH)